MANAYFMLGLPGSGKSTYIKNHLPHIPVISRDIIRAELGYTKSAEVKRLLPPEAEEEVTKMQHEVINYYCANNIDFVVDDTNNKVTNRKTLLNIVHLYPTFQTIGVWLRTDLNICIQRRRGQIKPETMVRLSEIFEAPLPNEFDLTKEISFTE